MENIFKREKTIVYNVEDLYVGVLGFVTHSQKNGTNNCKSEKNIIIYKYYEENNNESEYRDAICAKNVFTNKKYLFFHGNYYDYQRQMMVNNYVINHSYPLEIFFEIPRKTITKDELLVVYEILKYDIENEKEEKPTEPVTDNILKTILETSEIVKKSSIDEEIKQHVISELDQLGKKYIDEMIEINNQENEGLTFESEHSVRMNAIKKLVEIEQYIQNPTHQKVYSLKKQYNQFKQDLND